MVYVTELQGRAVVCQDGSDPIALQPNALGLHNVPIKEHASQRRTHLHVTVSMVGLDLIAAFL